MVTPRYASERGHANHGWLDAYHTFSFANFHDPAFSGFSSLLVLNQDTIAPGRGFGRHAHENMEIITYVFDGVLEHKDSMGNRGLIQAGDVQLMSAGKGITHSEYNPSEDCEVRLLQMWVLPSCQDTEPRYEQSTLSTIAGSGGLICIAQPTGDGAAMTIGADVRLVVGQLGPQQEATLSLHPGRRCWLHIAEGSICVNGQELESGDGAAIEAELELSFKGKSHAKFVVLDLP